MDEKQKTLFDQKLYKPPVKAAPQVKAKAAELEGQQFMQFMGEHAAFQQTLGK